VKVFVHSDIGYKDVGTSINLQVGEYTNIIADWSFSSYTDVHVGVVFEEARQGMPPSSFKKLVLEGVIEIIGE
jgi:hypothetical protein